MESLRSICDREIPLEMEKIDSFTASFSASLDSVKLKIEETVQNHVKLGKLKSSLREAEDEFVKVLSVKTRQEAKEMAIRKSISATTARVEELKKSIEAQRAKRDEHATILSNQSFAFSASEGKCITNSESEGEIQEAISWYNRVLGFQIEGGLGVKFTFNNINPQKPYDEYSFTVRHENDTYSLLACYPHLDDATQLIQELNKTNGLFRFVRTMREKFQEAASSRSLPQSTNVPQESSIISISAPVLSVSTDVSESQEMSDSELSHEVKRHTEKVYPTKVARRSLLSPESVRRTPRFKGKK